MSTFEDLIPDVEYESDSSVRSTSSSVSRKKILKENMTNNFNFRPIIYGAVSALVAIIAPFLISFSKYIKGDSNEKISNVLQIGIQMGIYGIIYGLATVLHYLNVF